MEEIDSEKHCSLLGFYDSGPEQFLFNFFVAEDETESVLLLYNRPLLCHLFASENKIL